MNYIENAKQWASRLEGTVAIEEADGAVAIRGPRSEAERERLYELMRGLAHEAEQALVPRVEWLRDLLSQWDPLDLLSECAMHANYSPPEEEFTHEKRAALEYLVGLALGLDRRSREEPPLGVGEAALGVAFDVLQCETEIIANQPPPPDVPLSLWMTQVRLRVEEIADRNQGYARPLKRIIGETLRPLRADCLRLLGFDPADVPNVIEACRRLATQRFIEGSQGAVGARWLRDMSRGLYEYDADEIASEAQLPAAQVHAALSALACEWGCQPGFRRIADGNRFRRFPVLALESGRFWFPLVWKPLDEFAPWFLTVLRERQLDRLEQRFLRARDAATETITREALASVFGENRVHGPLEYVHCGRSYEADAIVDAGAVVIAAEAKAHRVRDALRRGSAGEIRNITKRLLHKPFEQSARVATYVTEGGRDFRVAGTHARFTLHKQPLEVIRIATSFERTDPVTLFAASLVDDSVEPAWAVPLADFIAVAEVLGDPASFYAYAKLRARVAGDEKIIALMEPDLLGAFITGRLASVENEVNYFVDASDDIDSYFDADPPTTPPSLGIPSIVTRALQQLYDERDDSWPEIVEAVLQQPPDAWAAFDNLLANAHKTAARGRDARRELTLKSGLRLIVLTSSDDASFRLLDQLQAPPPWLAMADRLDTSAIRVAAAI